MYQPPRFARIIDDEYHQCFHCSGLIGKMPPELAVEGELRASIVLSDTDGKGMFIHPWCALRLANELNQAVLDFIEKDVLKR